MDFSNAREFLKSHFATRWDTLVTDQRQKLPQPPPELPTPTESPRLALPRPENLTIGAMPLVEAIRRRKSRREYQETPLSLEELSFLLWATQGVREVVFERRVTRRTVPSAGSRHPLETYLLALNVTGLEPGLYRYLAIAHELVFLRPRADLEAEIAGACGDFLARGAVLFIWTAVPYRTEWRYAELSHRMIAMDAGHACQNLYLACEAIDAGTCAVAAYDQEAMDRLVGVDGQDEFTLYVAPVGKSKT